MNWLATGKEEVLAHLERDAINRSETAGEYALGEDEDGNLFVFIAGHVFTGSGSLNLRGVKLSVRNGLITESP